MLFYNIWGKRKGEDIVVLLSELDQGIAVKLCISIEDKVFEFDSTVMQKHKQDVFFEPIRKDEKLLNVQNDNISVDILLLRQDEKPIIWQNCDMECTRYKHKVYYAAKGALNGKEYNRRGEYRLYIGEEIHARIGNGAIDRIVILKDLSNSGFAFVYPEEIEGADNAFVYMTYPAKLDEKVYELPLFGKVVRKMDTTDGKVVYGCVLLKKNDLIGHYINQKQMEQLAGKNERFNDSKTQKEKK